MRAVRPYLVGIGLIAFCTAVKVLFPPLGRAVPFVLYFSAPLAAALLGGRWPGLATALLATVVANLLFLEPLGTLSTSPLALLQSATFFLEAAIVTLVCDALLRSRARQATETRRLEVLHEVTAALSRALTVGEVGSIVVELGARAISAPYGAIWQLEEDRASLALIRHRGYPGPLAAAVERVSVDSPLPLADVLRTKETCWISSREEYARVYGPANRETYPVRTADQMSFFCAPLLVEGRAVGTLSFHYEGRHRYTEAERRFIEALVDQAALALHRAQLFASERETRAIVEREQRRFRAIFEHSLDGILLFDDRLRVVDANPAACVLLARTRDDVMGRSARELLPPEPGQERPLEQFQKDGVIVHEERVMLLPDGSVRLAELSAAADVLPGLHLLSFRDIDARKRAEESLRFLAEASRILASSLDYDETLGAVTRLMVPRIADWAAVDIVDPETRTLRRVAVAHVDPRKVDLARRLHEQLPPSLDAPGGVAKVIRTGVSELTERITDEMLVAALADKPVALAIMREVGLVSIMIVALSVRGANCGTITLASSESRRRFTPADVAFAEQLAGRAAGAIENALASRDRVRLAEAERDEQIRTRARFERLYRLTSALASTLTTHSVAERVGELAAQTVGSDATSLYVVDEADRALVRESPVSERAEVRGYERIPLDSPFPITRVVRDRRARFFESREAVAAESSVIAEALAANPFGAWAQLPLTGAGGSVIGVVTFAFRRPTAFREDDRQLMTAVADQCAVALDRARAYEAEAVALRKKDEFLAMLGHELRNPLAPIVTATNLIRLRGSASERELGILERQGKHLVRLVDDLLDVSRITSGKLALRQAPIEIADVVAQAVESSSKPFEDKRLRFHVNVPAAGLTVSGDRERLVQVMTNLLVNAAKFTPDAGEVTVTAREHGGAAVIEVHDDGEGIAGDLLPRVFDLFTQARQSSDRSGGGLGLGLSIARSIVTAHGGSIVAASEGRDRGTTMTVTLPLMEKRAQELHVVPLAQVAKPGAHRRRILIVDDNEDGAEMLATFFDSLGYETLVANDGPQALRVVGENTGENPLDAAVLDIGLPGMDGYELASEIQARFGAKSPVLVALTGYAQASDRDRALASGFRAHFGKPVDVDRLAATFDEILASA